MRYNIHCRSISWCLWTVFILGVCAFFPMMTYADSTDVLVASGSSVLFTPSANDQSIIYLGELFGSMPPVLAGTGSSLLGTLFKTFNTAVLTLGIIIAGYTTFVGILNTAGEGEMLGKAWSSIWIPIRTIAGIALLIPTASGYCVVQIFFMWLLVQGIGAADTLTSGIIDYMKSGQKVYVPGNVPNSDGTTNLVTTWDDTISVVYAGLSCMQGLQRNYPLVNTAYVTPPSPTSDAAGTTPTTADSNTIYYNFIAKKYKSTTTPPTPEADGTIASENVSCGILKYEYTAGDKTAQAQTQYLIQGLNAIMPSLNAAAFFMVNDNPVVTPPNTSTKMQAMSDTYNFVGSDFMNQVALTYNSYVIQASNAQVEDKSEDKPNDYLDSIQDYGWITIGNLYWDMAKSSSSGSISDSIKNQAKLAWLTTDQSIGSTLTAPNKTSTYDTLETEGNLDVLTYGYTYSTQFIRDLKDMRGSSSSNGEFQSAGNVNYSGAANGAMSAIVLAVFNDMTAALGDSTKSPMVAAQSLGHNIIYDVETALSVFVALEIVATTILTAGSIAESHIPFGSWGVGELTALFGLAFILLSTIPFLMILCGLLMTLGSVLAVVIPLIPALAFFLAAVAWMVATLETIVAAPIVAIGLIHPDGQNPVWGKAEPAVMLMTNMFLRPSLMVIGMAAGVLLSFISVQFVNFGYTQALDSILGGSGTGANITWVESTMFLSTYVGLILACVNKSFSTIDALPDTVMRWISGGEGAKFGGGQEAMQKLQGSQESAGQKAAGDSVSSSQESGQAADKAIDKADKGEARAKSNREEKAAHNARKTAGSASQPPA